MLALALWLAGLVGLVIAAAIASARARAMPSDVVGRTAPLAAALACAALAAGAIWVWGGALATTGREDRLAAGATVRLSTAPPVAAHTTAAAHATDATNAAHAAHAAHAIVRAGDVLRVGDDRTALPGVVNWDVGGGSAALLVVPRDPTDCAAWPGGSAGSAGTCGVAAGGATLSARPLVPDAAGVIARGTWAAIAIGAPAIALLGVLALVAPSRRRARTLATALRIAVLATALAALACWRLVWAHRIDVLRDGRGALVAQNQLAAVAIGAAIAGLAAGALAYRRRIAVAVAAWAAWGAIAAVLAGARPHATRDALGALVLSALAAIAPLLAPPALAQRRAPPALAQRRALSAIAARWREVLVLVAIAAAATATRALAPHLVLAKLGLAWSCVPAGHAALRALLAADTPRRVRLALPIALGIALLALARLDTGVTVAIAGSGLAIAMLVAGGDALYDARAAGRLGVLEREHARLLVAHGAAAILFAIAGAGWVIAATDHAITRSTTAWALCAPLAAAALYALTAVVARAHGRAMLPWLAAAVAAIALFCARDPLVQRATEGHSVAAARVAAIVAPGDAIQKDPRAFAATASAWREAELPERCTSAAFGEGFFAAHFFDPGVAKSIDNDYIAVLIAREAGAVGVVQTLALLLLVALAAATTASVRFRHASAEHRARWLVAAVAIGVCVYQPLAALGVLPLTGIGWPGLALDSPADLWLFVLGASWCLLGGDRGEPAPADAIDERVRATPRLRRARALVLAALCVGGAAAIALVARAAASALVRAPGDDARIAEALRAADSLALPPEVAAALHARPAGARPPRIRVVSAAMGAAARDAGELVTGDSIVRLHVPSHVPIAPGVALDVDARGITLRGPAQLAIAAAGAWQPIAYDGAVALDRDALIAAGGRVVLVRPHADPLLADDVVRAGERTRRAYPYGAALPELGWVNPYDVDRSLGLDGWIHAALRGSSAAPAAPAAPAAAPAAPAAASCGTLAPPPVARDRVCRPAEDGVTECRVALQPELGRRLAALADRTATDPAPLTGHAAPPVRVAYVVLRGDTGEILAQASTVPGRAPLPYAPADAATEATLVALRQSRGDRGVDWNLPIAVGSTEKPIVARAAELAFGATADQLVLTFAATPGGCHAHRGKHVDPLLGHCPPTSLADEPTTADMHDFLAHSLNWYQAALGILGLALPDGQLLQGGTPHTLDEIAAADLASWPTTAPLGVRDAEGPILDGHRIWIAGLRRTALWQRIEQLLGRPLCTLGDRASCARASERADVCAARALPIAEPSRDLRELVALGPDRIAFYADDRPHQAAVPVREYFQLLRGSGVHSIGSLAQLADAFGRVIYDDGRARLAASWFPAPAVGALPSWSCAAASGHAATVRGADGGLCAVVQAGGTAGGAFGRVLADPHVVVYGAKTGTTDSLADLARDPAVCAAWNRGHRAQSALVCGAQPPDDSLFVVAFGVVTSTGTVPITFALQLQRGGTSAAARSAPAWIDAIAGYVRGE